MSELFCQLGLDPPPSADNSRIISLMLVNKVIFLPENHLLIKSVISIHRRFKFSTNRPNCLYPPTPDRRQSKTFLTIDERHRKQGIWTPPPPLLKKFKNIGFPKQYWSGSPEKPQSYKCTSPAFNVGPPSARKRNATCWQVVGGPLIAVFGSSLLPSLT